MPRMPCRVVEMMILMPAGWALKHRYKGEKRGQAGADANQRETERKTQKVLCGLYVQPAVIPCKALLLSLT